MSPDARHPVPERTVTLAVLGTGAAARLDRRGGLRVDGRTWCIDWAVGSADGWHLASAEAVVRQSLVDAAPVVLSSLRVPDGSVDARCWAAIDGGRPFVLIELHDAAPVAVAVAVVVRPAPGGRVHAIELDGSEVRVDRHAALSFGRQPSRAVVGETDAVLAAIAGGIADGDWPDGGGRSATGDLAAAVVFPLPHTATLRCVVALDPGAGPVASSVVSALPDHEAVVSGWRAQTAGAPRVDLPEREVETAVEAARRHLLGRVGDGRPSGIDGALLDVGTVAAMAMALDEQGLHSAARSLLLASFDRQDSDGSFDHDRLDATALVLVALDRHRRLADDDAIVSAAIERIASAAHWLHRRHVGSPLRRSSRFFGRGVARDPDMTDTDRRAHDARLTVHAFVAAARCLRAVGQMDAAALVDDHAVALAHDMTTRGITDHAGGDRPPPDAIGRLRALVAEGSPLWTWPSATDGDDPGRTANFLQLVRSMLVDDSGYGIDLLPGAVDEWFGAPLAVHDLPTAFGRLSFALRWHGARPALLWDLVAHDRLADVDIRLAAPGLDPHWTSTARRSEALLAEPPHEHGLEHEPGPGSGTGAVPPTRPLVGEPDSFM